MLTFLLEALIRSSILIVAVWALLRLCRPRSANGEKFAWTLVAAALLVMPLLVWWIVAGTMPLTMLPAQLAVSTGALAELPPLVHSLGAGVVAIYVVGVLAFTARLGAGLLIGARLRRDAQAVPEWGAGMDVRLSARVHGPVSFGSTVLLPVCSLHWDAATLRAVLAHEREHIRNRDAYRLWLASLCRAIFWCNPLVHWLNRRLALLAELTSDAAAVEAIGDRSKYLDVLIRIAGGAPSPAVLVPMTSHLNWTARMRQLLSPNTRSVPRSTSRNAVVGSAILLLSAFVAGCAAKPLVLTGPAAASALQPGRSPSLAVLKSFYPQLLRQRKIQGKAIVRITVDADGRVVDTSIVAEQPAGVGLGALAQRVARAYRFHNTLHRPVITNLPVRFALQQAASGSPPTQSSPGG